MKYIRTMLFMLLIVQQSNLAAQTTEDQMLCQASNNVFLPGEVITYEIFYNWNFVWILAGEVSFSVQAADNDQVQLQAVGKTYESYEWFYKVRDTLTSFTDPTSMLPYQTVRAVHEGNYDRFDHAIYDRDSNVAISNMGKRRGDTNEETLQIEDCTHDILSIIYMMRNMDFDRGDKGKLHLNLYLDRKLYPIDVTFNGRRKKKIKGWGKCKTLKFEPQLVVSDIFKEGNGMEVWVSDDKNKIPLLIESPVSVGSIKAVLKSYDGLKHPLGI